MKDTIYPIDIATGEYVQGIQMTDEEERKRRKKYWELRNAKELRRICCLASVGLEKEIVRICVCPLMSSMI